MTHTAPQYHGIISDVTTTAYKVACSNGITAVCQRTAETYAKNDAVYVTYESGVWVISRRALDEN